MNNYPFGFNTVGGTLNGSAVGGGGGFRRLLWILLGMWILGSLGLGWLVKSVLFLVALVVLVPIVGLFAFQWWLNRNLVSGECPVCHQPVQGLNGGNVDCTSCGEALEVQGGTFSRQAEAGTIDIQAVEVMSQVVEE
jgi:hypothetical protein